MDKKNETLFKCPNDLNIKITKSTGEIVFDEDCCTNVSIILKNTGEMATSFLGSHNPQLVKVLEKTLKQYFKGIKKTLHKEYKLDCPEEVSVVGADIPEDKKWSGQAVPDIKKDEDKTELNDTSQKETCVNKTNTVVSGKTPAQKIAPKMTSRKRLKTTTKTKDEKIK